MSEVRKKPPVICTDEEIIAALEFAHGHTNIAADKLRMSRAALSARISRTPALKEVRLDIIGDILYVAESNVHEAVLEGDVKVSQWVLERRDPQKWGRTTKTELDAECEPIGDAP